jgi:beta-lactamase class A
MVAFGLMATISLSVVLNALIDSDRKALLDTPDTFDAQTVPDREIASYEPPDHSETIAENNSPDDLSQDTVISAENSPFSESSFTTCANYVYYGIFYFDENTLYTSGNSSKTPSASVIKVFIMEYAFHLMSTGELTPDSVISGRDLNSLIQTMIQDSNNEATNILIDAFGMDRINDFLIQNDYSDTVLQRRMLDTAARSAGKENFTSLDDCLKILKKFYLNREIYPYSEMLEIMRGQNIRTSIPRNLPADVSIANKTGELDDVENDIGIVFTEGSDYAVVALTYEPVSLGDAQSAIAQLAQFAYDLRFMTPSERQSYLP